jgi:adenosylcobinamide kinase/adenosylcobinamide-phosphate guanylyltransferase
MITLITGGGRSGKSRYALELAGKYGNRAFVASAVAIDAEMRERIAKHRRERGDAFFTAEAPLDPAAALRALPHGTEVALLDCLTVWLGNLMHEGKLSDNLSCPEIEAFLELLSSPPCDLIIVTNEVGMGIIPDNAMARIFRDLAGALNQRVAAKADRVILMVSGVPVPVKG